MALQLSPVEIILQFDSHSVKVNLTCWLWCCCHRSFLSNHDNYHHHERVKNRQINILLSSTVNEQSSFVAGYK